MDKSSFRAEQIERLEDFFQTSQSIKETAELLENLANSSSLASAQKIGVSISDDLQMPSKKLIAKLRSLKKDIYLARPTKNNQIDFVFWPETINLPESMQELLQFNPTVIDNSLDLIITPGMAFSTSGNYYVGIGVGNFDFHLNRYQTKSIGLAYSAMLFEKPVWDISMLDVPVDEIIPTD